MKPRQLAPKPTLTHHELAEEKKAFEEGHQINIGYPWGARRLVIPGEQEVLGGNSLAVPQFGLRASTTEGMGSTP